MKHFNFDKIECHIAMCDDGVFLHICGDVIASVFFTKLELYLLAGLLLKDNPSGSFFPLLRGRQIYLHFDYSIADEPASILMLESKQIRVELVSTPEVMKDFGSYLIDEYEAAILESTTFQNLYTVKRKDCSHDWDEACDADGNRLARCIKCGLIQGGRTDVFNKNGKNGDKNEA